MTNRALFALGLAAALACSTLACGGDDDNGGGPGPSGNSGTVAATITISANGTVSPADVSVPAGSRVTFVNNDTRAHEMASDPHPTHGSCPGLDQVGAIQPNQSRTSGNLNSAGNCRYHDHQNPDSGGLQGVVRVQ